VFFFEGTEVLEDAWPGPLAGNWRGADPGDGPSAIGDENFFPGFGDLAAKLGEPGFGLKKADDFHFINQPVD
jgi:hypothetical protein